MAKPIRGTKRARSNVYTDLTRDVLQLLLLSVAATELLYTAFRVNERRLAGIKGMAR